MTLIDAIQDGKSVVISFVDMERGGQWNVKFTKMSEWVKFFSPIVGALEQVSENEYAKILFVSEMPPMELEIEEKHDGSNGLA